MVTAYAVILAGGVSERFWPLASPARPKQLLALLGGKSFLKATLERIEPLVPRTRQLIVTSRAHAAAVREEVPDLPEENLLVEPIGRNTAPALGLASLHLERRDPDPVFIALPSDHAVPDEAPFRVALERAIRLAKRGETVVFGLAPDRPETGYGYLQQGPTIEAGLYQVRRFIEKPDRATAERLLKRGDYYWNSGIFVWRNDRFQRLFQRHLPDHWARLSRLREILGTEAYHSAVEAVYQGMTSISIDTGVLEQAEGTLMLLGEFRWEDVGTWAALARVLPADGSHNVVLGEHVGLETHNCVIYSSSRPIVTIGVEGLVIVETEAGVLVCPKERSQEVRQVARLARETSRSSCSAGEERA